MPLSITLTPGKTLQLNEKVDNTKLNQLGNPTLSISGQATTAQITDKAVTPIKSAPGAWFWGADTGGAGAHIVTLDSGPITVYTTGLIIAYRPAVTGVGGAITANVDNLGVKSIKLVSGQDPSAGDIRAGVPIELRYDGTNLVLLSPVVNDQNRVATSTGAANAYVLTFGGTTGFPTVTALKTGVRVAMKAGFAPTGAATLAVDGLPVKAIRKNGDVALAEGDIALGQFVQFIYDEAANTAAGAWMMVSPTVFSPPAAIIGAASNLITRPNTGTPLSKVDITADEVILKSTGSTLLVSTVSVTIDLAAAGNGANKLDVGTEAAGTWYYLWLISDGTTTAGLMSLSATTPTLPANYVFKALVGVVRNSGATAEGATSGDLVPWYQLGRRVWVRDINIIPNLFAASVTVYQLLSTTASIAVAPANVLPPIAKRCFGTAGGTTGGATNHAEIGVAADSNGLGAVTICAYNNGVTVNSFQAAGLYELPLVTAQDFYWRGATATDKQRLNISGYDL